MNKFKKLLVAGLVCTTAVAGGLCLTGCGNTDNNSGETEIHKIYDKAVASGYEGTYEEWLTSIKGEKGDAGSDGREVEFQVTETHIQWKYEGDTEWTDLIALSELKGSKGDKGDTGATGAQGAKGDKGDKGDAGKDLTVKQVTVQLKSNLPVYFQDYSSDAEQSIQTAWAYKDNKKTVDAGSWVKLTDFSDISSIGKYFLGWYIGTGVNETKFTSYTPIVDNATLYAKWDIEKIKDEYYSDGVKFESAYLANVYGDYNETKKWDIPENLQQCYVAYVDEYSQNNIVVPRTYMGKNVVGVKKLSSSKTIYLPDSLKFICSNAEISGDKVVVPKSVVAIGYAGITGTALIENGMELEFVGDLAIQNQSYNLNYYDIFGSEASNLSSALVIISNNAKYVGKQCLTSTINIIVNNSKENTSSEVFVEDCFKYNSKVYYYKIDPTSLKVKKVNTGDIDLEYLVVDQDGQYDTRPIIIDIHCSTNNFTYARVGKVTGKSGYLYYDDVCVIEDLCVCLNAVTDSRVIWTGITNLIGNVEVGGIDNSNETVLIFNGYVDSNIDLQNIVTSSIETIYLTTKYNTNMAVVEEYINAGFTKQENSDKTGYDMYIRNAE